MRLLWVVAIVGVSVLLAAQTPANPAFEVARPSSRARRVWKPALRLRRDEVSV